MRLNVLLYSIGPQFLLNPRSLETITVWQCCPKFSIKSQSSWFQRHHHKCAVSASGYHTPHIDRDTPNLVTPTSLKSAPPVSLTARGFDSSVPLHWLVRGFDPATSFTEVTSTEALTPQALSRLDYSLSLL